MVALLARPASEYLGDDEVVDVLAPPLSGLAFGLWRDAGGDAIEFSRSAFEYVRDQVGHACDVGDRRVTVTASETLPARNESGLCYAKAHLLTALLRARLIPAWALLPAPDRQWAPL